MESLLGRVVDPCPGNLSGTTLELFLAMINTLFAAQCGLKAPVVRNTELKDNDQYDFIVVGCGASGSVVASRLSEYPNKKVLIIEAGDDAQITSLLPNQWYTLSGSQDFAYKMEHEECACLGLKDQKCQLINGKMTGGSSSLNDLTYIRGTKPDYDYWAKLGNKGWGWEHVLPYYKKSENNRRYHNKYHSKGGYLDIDSISSPSALKDDMIHAYREMGYHKLEDLNADKYIGIGDAQGTSKTGERMSPFNAFIVASGASERPNLFIAKNSFVTKVLIDEKTKTAYGVQVYTNNNTYITVLAKNEVILTAGSVSNAKILMLSGIGVWRELQEFGIRVMQNLHVGRFLQDQPQFLGFVVAVDSNLTAQCKVDDTFKYILGREGCLGQVGIYATRGMISTNKEERKVPNIQFRHLYYEKGSGDLAPYLISLGFDSTYLNYYVDLNKKHSILIIQPTLLTPKSSGYVKLASPDPLVPPKISCDYLSHKHDKKAILDSIAFLVKLMKTKALKSYKLHPLRLNVPECSSFKCPSLQYYNCLLKYFTVPSNGLIGTAKMGPHSDDTAVVDSELKVRGIINLRVADHSISPRLTSASRGIGSTMIGEKAASFVIKDCRLKRKEIH